MDNPSKGKFATEGTEGTENLIRKQHDVCVRGGRPFLTILCAL